MQWGTWIASHLEVFGVPGVATESNVGFWNVFLTQGNSKGCIWMEMKKVVIGMEIKEPKIENIKKVEIISLVVKNILNKLTREVSKLSDN